MNVIRRHESDLLNYGIKLLLQNPNVILYGDSQRLEDRIPIISFNVRGRSHEETSKYLYEYYGIISKNGFCGSDLYKRKLTQGSEHTGLVRVSMALYNQRFEIDRLVEALENYS